jgi:hypothetical protein
MGAGVARPGWAGDLRLPLWSEIPGFEAVSGPLPGRAVAEAGDWSPSD